MSAITIFEPSYDPLSQQLSEISFHINRFGHQKEYLGGSCDTRIIGDRELIYNIGGVSHITIGQSRYELHAGDFILIPPFVPHKIGTSPQTPHNNYWIHFNTSLSPASEQLFKSIYEQWGSHSHHFGVTREMLALYASIQKENQNKQPGYFAAMSLSLKRIFLELLRHSGLTFARSADNSSEDFLFLQILHYISIHLCGITHTRAIAEAHHISLSYLNKLFHKHTGTSPSKFVMQQKLQRAEQLLHSTNETVQSIAEQLNFSSGYHFSNTFKQYYGVSPLHYRQINLNC